MTGCKEKVFVKKTRHMHRYPLHMIVHIQNPKVTETRHSYPKHTVNTIYHLISHYCLEPSRDNRILSFQISTVSSSIIYVHLPGPGSWPDLWRILNMRHWGLIWIFMFFFFYQTFCTHIFDSNDIFLQNINVKIDNNWKLCQRFSRSIELLWLGWGRPRGLHRGWGAWGSLSLIRF